MGNLHGPPASRSSCALASSRDSCLIGVCHRSVQHYPLPTLHVLALCVFTLTRHSLRRLFVLGTRETGHDVCHAPLPPPRASGTHIDALRYHPRLRRTFPALSPSRRKPKLPERGTAHCPIIGGAKGPVRAGSRCRFLHAEKSLASVPRDAGLCQIRQKAALLSEDRLQRLCLDCG